MISFIVVHTSTWTIHLGTSLDIIIPVRVCVSLFVSLLYIISLISVTLSLYVFAVKCTVIIIGFSYCGALALFVSL